jgi:putative NADH-flavin reductase
VDIFNEDDLAPHLKDSDAVVSCLGGSASLFGWTKCTLYTDSMMSIVGAMRKSGVKRLVAMSAWGSAGGGHNHSSLFMRYMINIILLNFFSKQ